jgi:RimJ/RimL family protein N-acetyltransferase
LKSGLNLLLRSPEEQDAVDMINFLKQTAGESDHLLRTPEEVLMTVPEEQAFLRGTLEDERRMMINAVQGDEIIGNVSVFPVGVRQRVEHRAEIAVAVRKPWWGLGIGSLLLREALAQAVKMGFEQLELTVFADNELAVRLYKSLGFESWGQRKNACKMKDGSYRDDLLMGIFLSKEAGDGL